MTIARWGWTNIVAAFLLCSWVVFLLPEGLASHIGCAVSTVICLFVVAFFRNPQPQVPDDPSAFASPATGTIADIEEVDDDHFIKGKAVRIGIFLSVFDVHVNRSPVNGTIAYTHYKPGKFLDARHPDATHHNEANTLGIQVDDMNGQSFQIVVRQISGLIARRIICANGLGDQLSIGELYGMIKFGSRTELFIPVTVAHEISVSVGDKVKCGETVLARLTSEGTATHE